MNNPTPSDDQEDLRLREVVVEAAIEMATLQPREGEEDIRLSDINASRKKCAVAARALRDHRAKVSAPEVVPRCEPPECRNGQYWLHCVDNGNGWQEGFGPDQVWDFSNGVWECSDGGKCTPEEHWKEGWRYHSPATPNRDDIRREPTDEEVDALIQEWRGTALGQRTYLKLVRMALDRFNAPLSEPGQAEIAEDVIEAGDRVRPRSGRFAGMIVKVISVSHGLVYFEAGAEVYSALEEDFTIYDKASWTAEPSDHNSIDRKGLEQENPAPAKPQTTISDEEIDTLAGLNCNFWVDRKIPWLGSFEGFAFRRRQVRAFARTLLAKHSGASTLPDKTLRGLWHLAHQNALDQFVTDAKRLVGR